MNYPHLTECLNEMFLDNFGVMCSRFVKPEEQWAWPENAPMLEEMASRLTSDEKLDLVAGEFSDMRRVIRKHGIQSLSKFINEVFDGELTKGFTL